MRHMRHDAMRDSIFSRSLPHCIEMEPLVFTALCGLTAFDLYAFATLATRGPRLRICFSNQTAKTFVRGAVISALVLNWIYLLMHWRNF